MSLLGIILGIGMVWMSKQPEITDRDGEWFWPTYLAGWLVAFTALVQLVRTGI